MPDHLDALDHYDSAILIEPLQIGWLADNEFVTELNLDCIKSVLIHDKCMPRLIFVDMMNIFIICPIAIA